MGRFLFGLLILLTCASESFAHGSIARGYAGNAVRFFTSANQATLIDAQTAALRQCRDEGLQFCATLTNFENNCAAVALSPNGFYNKGGGQDADQASAAAFAACRINRPQGCNLAAIVCDTTPSPQPKEGPASSLFKFALTFWPDIQISSAIVRMADVTLLTLCVWIFVSIVSTTPGATLTRRAFISAWIGLPALLAHTTIFAIPVLDNTVTQIATFLFLWTDVFLALAMGCSLRRQLSRTSPAPDLLSLPLAALAFTVPAFIAVELFTKYGFLTESWNCVDQPYPPFSACGYLQYQGFDFSIALLIVIIICGVVLPANSNLVRGYERLVGRKSPSPFGRHLDPLTHSLPFEQPFPENQTARPAKERITETPPQFLKDPLPNRAEEPELDKRAVKDAFQKKRQQFDL